jgi:cytochrome P450 / NADPH-cytochrome P450 reductase
MAAKTPIPEPPGLPILGNIADFNTDYFLGVLLQFVSKYGEIYRCRFPGGRTLVVCSTQALVNETCDEKRFKKAINAGLQVRCRDALSLGLVPLKCFLDSKCDIASTTASSR